MLSAQQKKYREGLKSTDVKVFSHNAIELRKYMLSNDCNYPKYHFVAPEGWMNDPNGLIFIDGVYHCFYQYNPTMQSGEKEYIAWGHAVSRDLFHWQDLPVAMWPDQEYDRHGVFSGNIVIDEEGNARAYYTGNVDKHNECYGVMAISSDKALLSWEKTLIMSERPTSDSPPHWDAQVWKHEDKWYQLIGGVYKNNGCANLYTSTDMVNWEFASQISSSKQDSFWELPYLVKLSDKYVLMIGVSGNPYWVGSFDYDTLKFAPENETREYIDLGDYYSFNPNMKDDKGRQIMFGWVTGGEYGVAKGSYWQGGHSIPRVITLEGGCVIQSVAEEINNLKYDIVCSNDLDLTKGHTIKDTTDAFSLSMSTQKNKLQSEGHLEINVCTNHDTAYRLCFDFKENRIVISADKEYEMPFLFTDVEKITFELFVDCSMLELYINGKAITARAMLKEPITNLRLLAKGCELHSSETNFAKMQCIWK